VILGQGHPRLTKRVLAGSIATNKRSGERPRQFTFATSAWTNKQIGMHRSIDCSAQFTDRVVLSYDTSPRINAG
jgi:hypothetical protein